jgi:hypothetical protein
MNAVSFTRERGLVKAKAAISHSDAQQSSHKLIICLRLRNEAYSACEADHKAMQQTNQVS